MKTEDDHLPNLQLEDDDNDEEFDPNMYGEEQMSSGADKQHNAAASESIQRACATSPLPRIKPEPEEITIEREQIPIQALDDHSIPMVVDDEPDGPNDILPLDEDFSTTRNPPKRRRLILEVLVFTWKDLQKQRKKDFEKIRNMNNPIVKKPKNIEFSLSSLYDRLKPVGLDSFKVTLEPDIRDQAVSRAFMASVYGGSAQDTFPIIGKAKQQEHGIRDFVYVNAYLHTHAPQWPGNPGFFFNSEIEWVGEDMRRMIFKTFVRLDSGIWMYVGDYRFLDVAPLSKEEWKFMTAKVRNAWVNYIMKKGWATSFRARVVARRELGRRPTRAEAAKVYNEGRANHVTPAEIHATLEAGHEQLGISGMKCVGYDEAFQRQLVDRFSRWVPPVPKPRGPRNGQRGGNVPKLESDSEIKPDVKQESKTPNTKTEPKTPKKTLKRKRKTSPESESDAELSPEPEGSDVDANEFLKDVDFKKKLRRTNEVKKQEEDEDIDIFETIKNDSDEDADWSSEGRLCQSQSSTQRRRSGTQDDPIIL